MQFSGTKIFIFSVNVAKDEQFFTSEKNPKLTVMSAGHALHVFINGQLSGNHDSLRLFAKNMCISDCRKQNDPQMLSNMFTGTVYGSVENPKLTYTGNVKLWAGSNTISCLSIAVGLPVSG